jgi:phage shock protein PspC (stress-responsive transcriptional regulator)
LARFVLNDLRWGGHHPPRLRSDEMQETQPALPLRDHTVLGVCEGLGEDFGFNPLWLRLLLASFLIWKPLEVIGVYFALGLLVMISRLLVPNRRSKAVPASAAPQQGDAEELAIAA